MDKSGSGAPKKSREPSSPRASKKSLRLSRAWQVQQKVLNAEGKEVLRDVAFELNDLNDGKTEVQTPSRDISGCS